jgi:hypothetical protein
LKKGGMVNFSAVGEGSCRVDSTLCCVRRGMGFRNPDGWGG